MIEIGARIVADHPLTGVGPNMVPRVYDQYRPDYAVNQTNPHLHNVPLQIAAERGLPALAVWLWFIARRGARAVPVVPPVVAGAGDRCAAVKRTGKPALRLRTGTRRGGAGAACRDAGRGTL